MPAAKGKGKQPDHPRDRKAHLAINDIAAKVARAQAHDLTIVLVLRTRPQRKVRGKVEARHIDHGRKLTGRDGESNLIVQIADEEVPLESIAEIRRPREGST